MQAGDFRRFRNLFLIVFLSWNTIRLSEAEAAPLRNFLHVYSPSFYDIVAVGEGRIVNSGPMMLFLLALLVYNLAIYIGNAAAALLGFHNSDTLPINCSCRTKLSW